MTNIAEGKAPKSFYIFDLDGTLANCDHRQHLAQQKEWEEFHAGCQHDKPYQDIAALATDLGACYELIVITGRDEKWRGATEVWLADHDILVDDIYMRPEGDRRPDHEYKLSVVDEIFGDRANALAQVRCWFEDRDNLVEKLRDAGFTILQVKAGAY